MIAANKDVLRNKLANLTTTSRDALQFLNRYDAAERVVTLTSSQKTAAMSDLAAMAGDIATAYQAAVAVFTASEPV